MKEIKNILFTFANPSDLCSLESRLEIFALSSFASHFSPSQSISQLFLSRLLGSAQKMQFLYQVVDPQFLFRSEFSFSVSEEYVAEDL